MISVELFRCGWRKAACSADLKVLRAESRLPTLAPVRREGKVVQETVAQLGALDGEGRAEAKRLARQLTGRDDQRELFEADPAEG